MNPNQTQFTRPDGSCALFTKPHIFECDLHDDAARAKVPELRDLFEQTELVGCMQQKMPNLGLVNGAGGVTLKLQFNEGALGVVQRLKWLARHFLHLVRFMRLLRAGQVAEAAFLVIMTTRGGPTREALRASYT